ncbi:39S ribosomal protein L41, mitochondrial-like [Penaeus japonicus]|uniref:39S ribosomal protein L41, mitochondrial-like n=1 Tax=Penaeus japonicus TaxID=27405 RepID=UPI001C70CEA9|nr:39S ribosomal protein L41, mitochondrial-like [Penaeus japonicus]
MALPSSLSLLQTRVISTSATAYGKKNFKKFLMYGKRGTRQFKQQLKSDPTSEFHKIFSRGVRPVGELVGKKYQVIPEMVPELIVPDLEGFKLKPYVSYRVPDVVQGEFRPQDLFHAVYSQKIAEDFKAGKLDEEGRPLEPSEEEQLTPETAKAKALMIGSDKF